MLLLLVCLLRTEESPARLAEQCPCLSVFRPSLFLIFNPPLEVPEPFEELRSSQKRRLFLRDVEMQSRPTEDVKDQLTDFLTTAHMEADATAAGTSSNWDAIMLRRNASLYDSCIRIRSLSGTPKRAYNMERRPSGRP